MRELENVIERAVVLDERDFDKLLEPASGSPAAFTEVEPLEALTARYVRWAYEQMGRNKVQTARALGISPNTLTAKLR